MEQYFLSGITKEYFVFTDAKHIYNEQVNHVHKIHQPKLGWPFDTLKRFDMFLRKEAELSKLNYLFFFNANMRVMEPIDASFLPSKEEKLLAVKHPWLCDAPVDDFTMETNPQSTAYIAPGAATHYFMGGLNGGITSAYLQLMRDINQAIQQDLANNIIAVWHDESHLNKYLLDKNIKIMGPEYGFPQGADLPFEQKIIILEKARFGGHDWLRTDERNIVKDSLVYLKLFIKKLLNR